MSELPNFSISPSQGVQLMALAELIRTGELVIAMGFDPDEDAADTASKLLLDVAQEIALQVPD